ncbi:MAG TPA: type IV toxin-antitoxin system AbiEi family antitoxin domain-containing protein [Plantibacter sp.]|uniref:type IV toxin-antitoxin system AbiEi family antitoxin domain-containing protein n=1 Tax=unclassified Plantibacter TaxID=2624265 RepID=UPI002CFE6BDC|nr:type IV toxin-antitoxin system AbiEi family antitoxin domain-containing protein [Plantibacter sp.]
MLRIERVIVQLGGIATRRQLLAAGFTGPELTAAVREAVISRVRQGYYASQSTPIASRVAVRIGGAVGCLTAAGTYGFWDGMDARVHVSVPHLASRLRTRQPLVAFPSARRSDVFPEPVVLHWTAEPRPHVAGPETWRVSRDEALRQVMHCAEAEDAIACWETALSSGTLPQDTLARIASGLPMHLRRRAALVQAGAESGPESLVGQRLVRAGFAVRRQAVFAGIGRVDLLVGERLVVEVDGFAYHSDPARFESDRRRDALLTAAGQVVIRLSFRQVMFDWPFCERIIREALATH